MFLYSAHKYSNRKPKFSRAKISKLRNSEDYI